MLARLKQVVKRMARCGGLDLDRLPAQVRWSLSERSFRQRGYQRIDGYDARGHFGDVTLDASFHYVVEGFVAARIQFIRQTLGSEEIDRATFVDIGDSNGVFLKALGKRGTSVNMSPKVLENIAGLETLQASLPTLPLPSQACDYALCFETVEHLHDPIGGLKELARLTRKGVFISIPVVRRTRIHPYWPDKGRPAAEQHVMEFCDTDFRKLLTYADLRVASMTVHRTFDRTRTLPEAIAYLFWGRAGDDTLCGIFRQFSIYFLVKERP